MFPIHMGSCPSFSLSTMAETPKNPRSDAWRYFKKVTDSQVKCSFCEAVLSYSSSTRSTKGMLDHLKAKHALEKVDDKRSVKEKFGARLFQPRVDFALNQTKFSKEKQETAYRAAAEVTLLFIHASKFALQESFDWKQSFVLE